MKLNRPHIPIAVRVQVAECQAKYLMTADQSLSNRDKLRLLLKVLFGDAKAELHHRPALVNRSRKRNGDYDPPANDPHFLVYLLEDDHDIETRVHGQHGQYSDLALARKNKRIARNRDQSRRTAKIAQPKNFKWPSRPFSRKTKKGPLTGQGSGPS